MLGEEKRSIITVNLKKYQRQIQHLVTDLKLTFLLKLLTTLNCKLFLRKTIILDVSQVLSLPPLTTRNQMFLADNKRAIPWFCGTVALTTKPRFYLLKVNNRNIKSTRARCEMCLELTARTPEWRQLLCSGVFIDNFQQTLYIHLVFPLVTLSE